MGAMAYESAATTAPLIDTPTKSTGEGKPRWNTYAFLCATLASMTTVLTGYNLAVMSGAQLFIREDLGLSDAQVEVLAGSINAYMLPSILAAGWAADALGRRGTLLLSNAFFTAGALATSLGGSFAKLMAARFVTMVGSGFAAVVTSVYVAEISPAAARGLLASVREMFISVGLLLGYVASYAFAGLPTGLGWRVMFAVGVVPPVLLAGGVLAMPESPRWLAMRGRYDAARVVLVRTSDGPGEADLRLAEIKQEVEAAALVSSGAGGKCNNVWKDLLVRPSASVRRILICVVGVHFFQQASGIDALVLYSPLVFKQAGMASTGAALVATVAVGAVKACFVLVATLLSDRLGRRPLLLASMAGAGVAMTSLSVTLYCSACDGSTVPPPSSVSAAARVASVLGFVAAFSVGLGPLAGMYSAEIIPLRLRAQGASLGIAVNRLTSGAVSMSFISLAGWITMPGCFFLYSAVAVAGCAFLYARIPETKGRSLEDMDVLFAK